MNYCDGAGQAGFVDCDAQHGQCDMCLIKRLESENEAMAKRLLFVDIVHGPKSEMRWAALVNENESLRNAVNIDIEAAAKMLAACMDYPWEHMPANGRDLMRRHAKDIVDAAISSPENPS